MSLSKIKITRKSILFSVLALALAYVGYLFGITGIRTISSFIIIFFIPGYIIVRKLDLDNTEKLVFGIFLGLGILPFTIFYANQLMPSFRISIIASFIFLALLGCLISRFNSKG